MNSNVQEMTDAILNDDSLVSRLKNSENSQEVSELLAEKGVIISPEKIDEFIEHQLFDGELSETDLENVAGGSFKLRYLNPFYWVGRLIAAAATSDMC